METREHNNTLYVIPSTGEEIRSLVEQGYCRTYTYQPEGSMEWNCFGRGVQAAERGWHGSLYSYWFSCWQGMPDYGRCPLLD